MAKVNVAIMETIQRFLAKLKEEEIMIDSAYLFGSYAKGIEDKWSDIDIALISSKFTKDRFSERVRLMRLASEIDLRLEPIPFCSDTFADENPLVWEIKREGVAIALKVTA